MAEPTGNSLSKMFGSAAQGIITALLIGAIGGLLVLWRDVSLMGERQRAMTAALERFKQQYDRREFETAAQLKGQFQLIIDLQRQQQSNADHLQAIERRGGGREPEGR
jgi:hypothetical protein